MLFPSWKFLLRYIPIGLKYRILSTEFGLEKGQEKIISEMNNQIHILITDVRDFYSYFAVPSYNSFNRILL